MISSCNLALIDDDVAVLDALDFSLSNSLSLNLKIHKFSKGQEFIERHNEIKFDLVVLDLDIPDLSGIEIIKYIKSANKSTPVIVLTGNSVLLRRNLDIHSMIFEVLIKPFEHEQLFKAINEGLACIDFYYPPEKSENSLDDMSADQKIAAQLIQLNHQIKKLLNEKNPNLIEISRLVDSQEKLFEILQNQ